MYTRLYQSYIFSDFVYFVCTEDGHVIKMGLTVLYRNKFCMMEKKCQLIVINKYIYRGLRMCVIKMRLIFHIVLDFLWNAVYLCFSNHYGFGLYEMYKCCYCTEITIQYSSRNEAWCGTGLVCVPVPQQCKRNCWLY
jgi:hypothetical protein